MLRFDLWRARRHDRAIGRISRARGLRLDDPDYVRHAEAWNALRDKHPGFLFNVFTDRKASHRALREGPTRASASATPRHGS